MYCNEKMTIISWDKTRNKYVMHNNSINKTSNKTIWQEHYIHLGHKGEKKKDEATYRNCQI